MVTHTHTHTHAHTHTSSIRTLDPKVDFGFIGGKLSPRCLHFLVETRKTYSGEIHHLISQTLCSADTNIILHNLFKTCDIQLILHF